MKQLCLDKIDKIREHGVDVMFLDYSSHLEIYFQGELKDTIYGDTWDRFFFYLIGLIDAFGIEDTPEELK